ncbi:CBS domain-containing protein [Shewanella sp. YIC-542]|uniref:CBS domain-containing protein n=1 Tax=Shewanella mytili TaxID=3377111 RepID=UPI00398E8BA1
MKTLHTYTLDTLEINAHYRRLSAQSAASSALINVNAPQQMALHADMSVPDAYKVMTAENAMVNYVINDQNKLLGIITRHWLSSDNLVRYTDKTHGPAFWCVADVMLPIAELPVVDAVSLRDCSVLDVLDTFRRLQRDFLLVLNRQQQILGLLSAEDILGRLRHAPQLRDQGGEVLEILRQLRESHGFDSEQQLYAR